MLQQKGLPQPKRFVFPEAYVLPFLGESRFVWLCLAGIRRPCVCVCVIVCVCVCDN